MLVIRFLRIGKKNQPSFKIVVTDKRKPPRGGRFVEEVGFWNPLTKEKKLKIERVKYWLSVGAKPSGSVYNLLVSEKIIEGKKVPVHKKPKKEKEAKETGVSERSLPKKAGEEKPSEKAPLVEQKPVKVIQKEEEIPAQEPQKEEKKKELSQKD